MIKAPFHLACTDQLTVSIDLEFDFVDLDFDVVKLSQAFCFGLVKLSQPLYLDFVKLSQPLYFDVFNLDEKNAANPFPTFPRARDGSNMPFKTDF